MRSGRFFISAGLVLLIFAAVLAGRNLLEDRSAGQESQAIVEAIGEEHPIVSRADTPAPAETEPAGAWQPDFIRYPDMDMPTMEIRGNPYIGVLEVPAAELTLPVMAQWDYSKLNVAPCRFTGSAYSHDLVICGHNYQSHFSPLRSLQPGETAVFTDADGNRFYYTLAYTDILMPDDVEQMTGSDGTWDMTLFTCTIGGKSRFTLRFTLDRAEAAEAEAI